MLNEIYTQLYSETEQGKRSWREVSRGNAELLRKISGEGIDQCRLEDALTAAGEAGMEHGFALGVRFIMELMIEAMI